MIRDERGLITGFIIRMILGFAIMGVILFDLGAVAVNFFSVDQNATTVAQGIIEQIATNEVDVSRPKQVRRAARELAEKEGAKLLEVEASRSAVTVRLEKEASTLIVQRVTAIEKWGMATAEVRASASP